MNNVDVSANTVSEKKVVRRCPECRAKLLLTDITCKCGVTHCSKHRVPELHNCTFDFKAAGTQFLSTSLVKLVGTKMEKI
jgi:predicted nucleic acid binding AN1-type Zn finger protein